MQATRGKQVTLGIDIGGTRIKAVALDDQKRVMQQYEGPSDAKNGPDAVRKALALGVEYFRGKELEPTHIGIGCAGSVEPRTGVVRNSPNFSAWKNVPLKEWVQSDFRVPVAVENDANCAVFAEWKVGSGQGYQNVVLLTLGTGIGGGLVLNGQLYRGSTGTGGELGHLSIYANGKECPCGNRGCFERYCSASALREAAGGKYSAREIFMQATTEYFAAIVRQFMSDFQVGLTSIANVFDPDVILIGGGVARGVATHFDELKDWLRAHAFPAVAAKVKLDVTKHGNLSGAIGAALLSSENQ